MRFCTALFCLVAVLQPALLAADPSGFLGSKPMNLYPEADPALEWSEEKNVVWKTPLPDKSNALPLVVGDTVFVLSEPSTIIAVNRADGSILWQKTNTIEESLTPEDQKRKAELAALRPEKEAVVKEAKQEFDKVNKLWRKDKKNEDLSKQRNELRGKLNAANQELEKLLDYEMPRTHNDNGYSSATPVSDGTNVYCFFGNGVGAAYDLKGNRLWIRYLERPGHSSWGRSASPVIAAGKVFIGYKDLHALNLQTGKTEFTVETGHFWGTPWVETMGEVPVVFVPKGMAVDARNGTVLAKDIYRLQWNGPAVVDGVLYAVDVDKATAYKLPAKAEPEMALEQLWQTEVKKDRYYGNNVVHEGLLYALGGNGSKTFTVLDAKTGETIYAERLPVRAGRMYSSVTLVGDHIIVNSDRGETLVFKTGREYQQVALNSLGKYRTNPTVDGDQLLIRTEDALWCIGKK